MVGRGGKFCTGEKIVSFLASPLDLSLERKKAKARKKLIEKQGKTKHRMEVSR
jgi:hypothetical protein